MDFFEKPLQNRPHNVWVAHSGFKTEQCSETLNALKPFKSVFFSTGCANMMAMVHVEQFSSKICAFNSCSNAICVFNNCLWKK